MKVLCNTEGELKKSVGYNKKRNPIRKLKILLTITYAH